MILPHSCVACDAPANEPGQFCPSCFLGVSFITPPFCNNCGVPFASRHHGGPDGVCLVCRTAPPSYRRARAAWRYDHQSRRLILQLKHGDRTELARALAPHMARAGSELLRDADVLAPVPLHRKRLFRRRYNQAALLARAVGRIAGRKVIPDALIRTRPTASLGDKSAAERTAEVTGAFMVRPRRAPAIAGRRVLLIDDVLTSGATAEACAAALLAGGARQVDVLAAARVPAPPGDPPQ
ncbi:MAG: ComF family protein [Acetobacteraceae bacterium]|nr:ComF family protein [Acetobacteraceae bacterium]MBV8521352.1 ComF family protein [Acetobacteraceae bacterium]